MSTSKEPSICEVTRDGTVIEVGGEDRCVVVDMGGDMNVAVCDVPVETLRMIASKFLYQPVKVTISLHYPDEPLLKP